MEKEKRIDKKTEEKPSKEKSEALKRFYEEVAKREVREEQGKKKK